nr:transposase [Mesorhizobium caraganae]
MKIVPRVFGQAPILRHLVVDALLVAHESACQSKLRATGDTCGSTPPTSRCAAAGRIVSVVVIIAVGVNRDGRREVLGTEIGRLESEPIWTEFCAT